MSDFHYMNDSSEENYFLSVFEQGIKKIYNDFADEQKIRNDKSNYMKQYMHNLSDLNSNICFICCFSKKRDDLNQWRSYGDDGKGICIGFEKSYFQKLMKKSRFFAEDIKYCSVEELYSFILNKLGEIMELYSPIDKSVEFTQCVYKELGSKRAKFKSTAFSDEKEFRIGFYDKLSNKAIKQYVFGNEHIGGEALKINMEKEYKFKTGVKLSVVNYRTSKNLLVPYRKLELGTELFKAIKSITIGPKCHVSKTEIAKFMAYKCDNEYCGYEQVFESNIPYV